MPPKFLYLYKKYISDVKGLGSHLMCDVFHNIRTVAKESRIDCQQIKKHRLNAFVFDCL